MTRLQNNFLRVNDPGATLAQADAEAESTHRALLAANWPSQTRLGASVDERGRVHCYPAIHYDYSAEMLAEADYRRAGLTGTPAKAVQLAAVPSALLGNEETDCPLSEVAWQSQREDADTRMSLVLWAALALLAACGVALWGVLDVLHRLGKI